MIRINQLLLTLLTVMAPLANAADEDAVDASATTEAAVEPSNRQSWEDDDRVNNWTWFGMGYESRRSFSEMKGAANPASPGGAGAGGPAGPGGPGGRK